MPTEVIQSIDHEITRMQAVLDERARALARPIAERRDDSGDRDVVIFAIKPETYAIDCRYVRAITRSNGIATIPGTPPFVVGVIRVRGEIHSVFDLRSVLGNQRQAVSSDAKIIALGEHRIEFCLLADDVAEITALAASDIHSRDADQESDGKSIIQGVTTGAVLVLDAAAMLRDQNLYVGHVVHI